MFSTKPFLWKSLKTMKNRIVYITIYILLIAVTLKYYSGNNCFYLLVVTYMSEIGLSIYSDFGSMLEIMFTLPFNLSQIINQKVQAVIIKAYGLAAIIYLLYICRMIITNTPLLFKWIYSIEIIIFGFFLYQLGLVLTCLAWILGKKYKQIVILIQIALSCGLVFSKIMMSSIYWGILIIGLSILFKVIYKKLVKASHNENIIMKGMY